MKRKGQVWTTDFLIGLMLFIVVILIALKVFMSMDINDEKPATYTEAIHLSSELLTRGYPKNWTNETVIKPGIAMNNKINMTQLDAFTKVSYNRTLMLYQMSSDYIFFFSNGTGIINISRCTYGYPVETDENCTPQFSGMTYSDLSKIERIVLLNESVVRMTIYAWQ